MASRAAPVLRYFFLDLAGSIVRFPVWWFGTGFVGLLGWMRRELQFRWKSYGFAIWMHNFFVPMYGQHDWTGRLVSIFMRFVVLIGRLIALAAEVLGYAALTALWLMALPILFFLLVTGLAQGALAL